MEVMTKKVVLNENVNRLVDEYIRRTGISFDDLTNKALKCYIVNKLSSKDVKKTLKRKDSDTYPIDDILKNGFGNWINEQ
ncbi:hypothetical protein ETI37_01420 [Lactobacillus mulieris]|nr:hypothetical protein HMPREF0974_01151 [Lactobacillus jensenii 115-3-CHN]EFH30113.1 hypothetical protein HMPREF0526_10266 [Lactobacillus jensenii JV-V16]KAA9244273.1 hypothetical protein F6I33_04235 [Lactobacillus jensenii]NKC43428.1 hypothetical protein [Lactobacillus mulieris]TRT40091.1 hypothetical protein ETI26_00615 [Lactobacillus sp. c10Ua232AE]